MVQIPTTQEIFEQILATLEGKLGQTSPLNEKSLLRVLSALQSGLFTTQYKWVADKILQNLALTATDGGLDLIGSNYGITRKQAEAAAFTIELPAGNGTVIPITNEFVGDANGIRYSIDAAATASGGVATINVTSQILGVAGNLNVSDTMTISTPVPGAESQAEITVITNTGAEQESDTNYRQRILDEIRAVRGGGNAADYRSWAQEVAGVQRAYPFAGKPIGSGTPSAPPDRTVYVEATTSIDPDGIASTSMLAEVRACITTDPETGLSRQPLGLTDDTLYVESIVRTTFYVTVSTLEVAANVESACKVDIENALDLYFRSVRPYVDGVDAPSDRNDTLTDPSVSTIVQDVVASYGGSVGGIAFDVTPGTSIPKYQLNPNELGKLGAVAYA